ncbi:methyltransferase [Acinetobacter sp. AM]|jgi:methylated-DNA-protein-cysteine methyltransferase-like protein|uniref:MGMT family protein n=1 Tax=Acinetobacter sp. AM TaxID=2170730 RepID=UPI000DE63FB2|nr:MGMT family protein [Acinetobacter sp. AM]PWB15305.1 methyltransferase [Acinetobacter sp. AM]
MLIAKTSSQELALLILQVVALIPYGKVATYGQIAKMAGLPKHARLVGRVLQQVEDQHLPWHRVINSQGKISLSKLDDQGDNLQIVKLQAENIVVIAGKINLKLYQWDGEICKVG